MLFTLTYIPIFAIEQHIFISKISFLKKLNRVHPVVCIIIDVHIWGSNFVLSTFC
jgi:hypothetical protein